jgi:hypothetical protein
MQARLRYQTCSLCSLIALAVSAVGTAQATIITTIQYENSGNYGCLTSSTAVPCAPITQSGALTNGTSTGPTAFSYPIDLGDGDDYVLSGNFFGSYSEGAGGVFVTNATLTYVGATPSVQGDTVQVDLEEGIYDNTGTSYNGTFTEAANLCGPSTGTGWTMTAQEFIDSSGLPLLGPSSTGCKAFSASMGLTGLTNPLLSEDWQYVFTMNAGAPAGFSLSTMTPEPAETLPAALVLGWLVCVMITKKRKEGLN